VCDVLRATSQEWLDPIKDNTCYDSFRLRAEFERILHSHCVHQHWKNQSTARFFYVSKRVDARDLQCI
jgi:hypothetical protein